MSGEFAAIRSLRAHLSEPEDPDETWIGDDTAVLRWPSGKGSPDELRLLLCADTVVAGVHADLALTGLDDLGWKALAACASDVAAMGGELSHAVVAVTAPAGTDLTRLYEGVGAAAEQLGCPVVGGDLTSGPALVVTVALTGRCVGPPVLRSGARAGDTVWLTGPLGAAAAGLRLLRSGVAGPSDDPDAASAVAAHRRPRPHLGAGAAARRAGATAMIDISDGLGADAAHLARSSGVGLRLEGLPVHPAATREEALQGGDDYVLLFCAPATASVPDTFAGLDTPIAVGCCTPDSGRLELDGLPLADAGWEHRF